MDSEALKALLGEALPELDEIHVSGEGSHFQIIAVSDAFSGMTPVKRQQMIYQPLADHISSGALHAISIKTYTPDVWQRERKLMFPS